MIDHDYEDRLIERIDIRKAVREAFTPRQRDVFRGYLRGHTLREAASDIGLSIERIRQLRVRVFDKLQKHLARVPVSLEFDKAAFIEHMRGLKERRAKLERMRFEAERREFKRLVIEEQLAKGSTSKIIEYVDKQYSLPPPPSGLSLIEVLAAERAAWEAARKPRPLPSREELNHIADEALSWCNAKWSARLSYPRAGNRRTYVTFPREGGVIVRAMEELQAAIPAHAMLAAEPLEIPEGMLAGQSVAPFGSVTVTVSEDATRLTLHMAWFDHASA